MNNQTLVAVYDTAANAEAAIRDLEAANVPAGAISQHAKSGSASDTTSSQAMASVREPSFWSSLFGGEPDHHATVYNRSIESGSTVVTVRVTEADIDRVSAILEKYDPIDLEERAGHFGLSETKTAGSGQRSGEAIAATADKDAIELAEETLSVGKRAVSGGTTRIRRYVVETPIEKQVTLHSEKVTLERRPVTDGRPVSDADFTDKAIEMTETSEEAVVAKTARVKEEVSLRKEASDRVETVKDTVRRDEVEIEQVPGGQASIIHGAGAVSSTPKSQA